MLGLKLNHVSKRGHWKRGHHQEQRWPSQLCAAMNAVVYGVGTRKCRGLLLGIANHSHEIKFELVQKRRNWILCLLTPSPSSAWNFTMTSREWHGLSNHHKHDFLCKKASSVYLPRKYETLHSDPLWVLVTSGLPSRSSNEENVSKPWHHHEAKGQSVRCHRRLCINTRTCRELGHTLQRCIWWNASKLDHDKYDWVAGGVWASVREPRVFETYSWDTKDQQRQWKRNVVILTKLSTLPKLEVVKMTTSGLARRRDEIFIKMMDGISVSVENHTPCVHALLLPMNLVERLRPN